MSQYDSFSDISKKLFTFYFVYLLVHYKENMWDVL